MRACRSSPPSPPHSRRGCWRSAAAGASSPNGSRARRAPRSSPPTSRRAWSSSRASAASTRALPTCRSCRSPTALRRRRRGVDALPRAGSRPRRRRARACPAPRRSPRRGHELALPSARAARARRQRAFDAHVLARERRGASCARTSRACGARTSTARSSSPIAREVEEYVRASISMSPFVANLPPEIERAVLRAPRQLDLRRGEGA